MRRSFLFVCLLSEGLIERKAKIKIVDMLLGPGAVASWERSNIRGGGSCTVQVGCLPSKLVFHGEERSHGQVMPPFHYMVPT